VRFRPSFSRLIRLVGLALFVLVLLRIDFTSLKELLGRANLAILASALGLIAPMMVVKTARWVSLQKTTGFLGGSFFHSLLAYTTGMYAGLITPGRLGELVRVRYLQSRGAEFERALATVLWDRVIDVAGLLTIGVVALWPLSEEFRGLYGGLVLMLAVLGAALLSAVFLKGWPGLARWRAGRFKRFGFVHGGLERIAEAMRATLLAQSLPSTLWLCLLTLLGWAVYFLQAYLLALSLGIGIDWLPLVVSVTAAAVASFLPVSISGLGTRDATLALLMPRFGRTREEAVALSTLILLALVVNGAMGFLASQILDSGRLSSDPARAQGIETR
jgi:hypothetical protein